MWEGIYNENNECHPWLTSLLFTHAPVNRRLAVLSLVQHVASHAPLMKRLPLIAALVISVETEI